MSRRPSSKEALPIWPLPTHATSSRSSALIIEANGEHPLFVHATGCADCSEILKAAFDRAKQHIFFASSNHSSTILPHLRVRVPSVRDESSAPPERRFCFDDNGSAAASSSIAVFRTLEVVITSHEPTPLQLGVDESYSLELTPTNGKLTASTEWGALHGIETFTQLVQWDGSRHQLCALPLSIRDEPAYRWRGLLLDTSRHFIPVTTSILPLLDAMAAVKLNVLHWHLTDAHSFPFASEVAPELARLGAHHPSLVYTPGEMRAVVAAAHARGIRVVPELDMPGHVASWAHGRPDVVVTCPERVAEDDEGLEHGANRAALHPLNEATYTLIAELLAELASIFPDRYMHLGGDEVDGQCWLSDAAVAAWAAKRRRTADWKLELQAIFTARVTALASRHNKRVVLWDEALEVARVMAAGGDQDAAAIAPSLVIDVWRDWVRTSLERREQALRAGHEVVWSALAWYLDIPGNTWESMYGVDLPPPARGGGRAGLLGGEASSWSEHADPANLFNRIMTRSAVVAERLWSREKSSSLDAVRQRLAALRCRLMLRGIVADPVMPDHCGAALHVPPQRSTAHEPPLTCVATAPASPSPMRSVDAPCPGGSRTEPHDRYALTASIVLNVLLLMALVPLLKVRGASRRRDGGKGGRITEPDGSARPEPFVDNKKRR